MVLIVVFHAIVAFIAMGIILWGASSHQWYSIIIKVIFGLLLLAGDGYSFLSFLEALKH